MECVSVMDTRGAIKWILFSSLSYQSNINQDSLNQYNSRPFPDSGQRTPRKPFNILTYADRLNLPVPIALNAITAPAPIRLQIFRCTSFAHVDGLNCFNTLSTQRLPLLAYLSIVPKRI